jgi:hypothetical protein
MQITVMVNVSESPESIQMESSGIAVEISKMDGSLVSVRSGGEIIPLKEGPVFKTTTPALESIEHYDKGGSHQVRALYKDGSLLTWTLSPTGLLGMDLKYRPETAGRNHQGNLVPYTGANFSFPESEDLRVRFLGKGPYRVWQNRMAGPAWNVWDKEYNNTITGHSGFEYPEFKGYYADLYWAEFTLKGESLFTVYSHTKDLFLRLFTPGEAEVPARTRMEHPPGDVGFMLGIPAIGTKFKNPEWLGPGSMGYHFEPKRVEGGSLHITLSFDFRN